MNYQNSIKYWPEMERPREKLISNGASTLSNGELIAILIGTGASTSDMRMSALDLAKKILREHENLASLLEATPTELSRIKGIGKAKATRIIAALEIGKRAVSEKNGNNVRFRCSEEVANYYLPLLKNLKKEQFRILLLDIKNKVIRELMISQGSLTTSVVHPREVLKSIIKESAASVIFLHNHPSGDPEPSSDDIEITNRLCKSCSIIGINVLDHIIVAENGYFSFKLKQLI